MATIEMLIDREERLVMLESETGDRISLKSPMLMLPNFAAVSSVLWRLLHVLTFIASDMDKQSMGLRSAFGDEDLGPMTGVVG